MLLKSVHLLCMSKGLYVSVFVEISVAGYLADRQITGLRYRYIFTP